MRAPTRARRNDASLPRRPIRTPLGPLMGERPRVVVCPAFQKPEVFPCWPFSCDPPDLYSPWASVRVSAGTYQSVASWQPRRTKVRVDARCLCSRRGARCLVLSIGPCLLADSSGRLQRVWTLQPERATCLLMVQPEGDSRTTQATLFGEAA